MPARPARPARITRDRLRALALAEWARSGPPGHDLPSHYLVAIRPYWSLTIGKPGNDINHYDDLLAFVTPQRVHLQAANLDPTRYGWNAAVGKPMAVLNPGCWPFRRGPHKGRTPALRQMTSAEARHLKCPTDGRFAVTRTRAEDDARNYIERGYFAINIHPGGRNGTSSEGCLTLPPDISDEFLGDVWATTEEDSVDVIWTILLEGPVA